jgi:predicted  nucleic acid-binding Zn-ribbon protein
MSIEGHIEELRAELKGCTDAAEFATISRELDAAIEQKVALEAALEAEFRTRS